MTDESSLEKAMWVTSSPMDASIYQSLSEHQRVEAWSGQAAMRELQCWLERFVVEFKLAVPPVALCLEELPKSQAGHFRPGHNGFGLKCEIAINRRMFQGEFEEVLGTLLHELLHAWQLLNGRPAKRNHHNAQFREKAKELGLLVDEKGFQGYAADSPFKNLLWMHGVRVSSEEKPIPKERPKGQSKLKKWSCQCGTNLRVAKPNLRAMCLDCNAQFVPADA